MANYKLLLALLMATTASFVAGRSLYLLERSSVSDKNLTVINKRIIE